MNKLIIYIALLLFVGSTLYLTLRNTEPNNSTPAATDTPELQITYYPDTDAKHFPAGRPFNFHAKDHSLYMVDQPQAQIIRYSLADPDESEVIGGPGAGPGEMFNPFDFTFVEDTLVVYDYGNQRLSYYEVSDTPSAFNRVYNLPFEPDDISLILNMEWADNSFVTTLSQTEPMLEKNTPIFVRLNRKGEVHSTYGKIPEFVAEMTTTVSENFTTAYNDTVFTIFTRFPFLKFLDTQSGETGTIKLDYPGDPSRPKENYEYEPPRPAETVDFAHRLYFDPAVTENYIFVSRYIDEDDHLIIDQYDRSGQFLRSLDFKPILSHQYEITDIPRISVVKNEDDVNFWLLLSGELPRVASVSASNIEEFYKLEMDI